MTPGPSCRKCTAYLRLGPGGMPLALRLTEGLGSTRIWLDKVLTNIRETEANSLGGNLYVRSGNNRDVMRFLDFIERPKSTALDDVHAGRLAFWWLIVRVGWRDFVICQIAPHICHSCWKEPAKASSLFFFRHASSTGCAFYISE